MKLRDVEPSLVKIIEIALCLALGLTLLIPTIVFINMLLITTFSENLVSLLHCYLYWACICILNYRVEWKWSLKVYFEEGGIF